MRSDILTWEKISQGQIGAEKKPLVLYVCCLGNKDREKSKQKTVSLVYDMF